LRHRYAFLAKRAAGREKDLATIAELESLPEGGYGLR
jgi:hypothetical protein